MKEYVLDNVIAESEIRNEGREAALERFEFESYFGISALDLEDLCDIVIDIYNEYYLAESEAIIKESTKKNNKTFKYVKPKVKPGIGDWDLKKISRYKERIMTQANKSGKRALSIVDMSPHSLKKYLCQQKDW